MNRLLVLFVLLSAPSVWAEPATINAFEAPAYERPDKQSPVLHTFVERAEVSVSEQGENGFRKARLPDGKVAYVEESLLSFANRPAAPAQQPVPSDAPVQPKREASIFVKDLDHLAQLVKSDPEVAPMARGLAVREQGSTVVLVSSLAAGAALTVVGLFVVPQTDCGFNSFGGQSCFLGAANYALAGTGLGVMGVGGLVGLLMKPNRGELLDVLNAWNRRHPEEPFEYSSGNR